MLQMALTSKLLMNSEMQKPTSIITNIHHQNSERRLRPLKSRIRTEANFMASVMLSEGISLMVTIPSLLDDYCCPTMLVFDLAVLDAAQRIEQAL